MFLEFNFFGLKMPSETDKKIKRILGSKEILPVHFKPFNKISAQFYPSYASRPITHYLMFF